MLKYITLILLFCSFSLTSCSNNDKKSEKEIAPIEKPVIKQVEEKITIEALPVEMLQTIFQECNSLDITFYDSDKTLNLWDDNVKHVLSMVTAEAPLALDNKIIGHIMMLKDGNQMAFVEVSLKEGNSYLVYNMEDKKYYNNINEKGLEFFTKFAK